MIHCKNTTYFNKLTFHFKDPAECGSFIYTHSQHSNRNDSIERSEIGVWIILCFFPFSNQTKKHHNFSVLKPKRENKHLSTQINSHLIGWPRTIISPIATPVFKDGDCHVELLLLSRRFFWGFFSIPKTTQFFVFPILF